MRGRSEGRDRCAGHPRQEMVAGRQHVYAPRQSRGQRVSGHDSHTICPGNKASVAEGPMGSLAVSRLAVDDDLPSASIADQVAAIARKNLAPLAPAIDEGTYP